MLVVYTIHRIFNKKISKWTQAGRLCSGRDR